MPCHIMCTLHILTAPFNNLVIFSLFAREIKDCDALPHRSFLMHADAQKNRIEGLMAKFPQSEMFSTVLVWAQKIPLLFNKNAFGNRNALKLL